MSETWLRKTAYLLFCIVLACGCYLKPVIEFDTYEYVAAVAMLRANAPEEVSHIVHQEFGLPDGGVPPGASPYLSAVLSDPKNLVQVASFNRTRPLYVSCAFVLWSAGIPMLTAFKIIGAISILLLGVVLFFWHENYLVSSLVLFNVSFVGAARSLMPDILGTALVAAGLCAISRRMPKFAVAALLIAVWTRPDSIIIAGLVLIWLAGTKRIRPIYAVIAIVVAIGSVLVIEHVVHFHTGAFLRSSIVQRVLNPVDDPTGVTVRQYLWALFVGLREFGSQTTIGIWSLVGIAAWRMLPSSSEMKALLIIAFLSIIAHFFLFPIVLDRYFLSSYVICGAAFGVAISKSVRVS